MATTVSASGNPDIDGILWGSRMSSTKLTYSIPTSANDYAYGVNGFQAMTDAAQQAAIHQIMAQVESVCGIDFTFTTGRGASIRFAEADSIDLDDDGDLTDDPEAVFGTARGIAPSSEFPSYAHGDTFYNHTDYNTPLRGNYGYHNIMHEVGHALGLDHGHGQHLGALPTDHDSVEYSIMTYRSYVGADTNRYYNEAWGYSQTLMQNDIAALQYMYGANFNHNSDNTTYTWNETTGEMSVNFVGQGAPGVNRIFMTVWDGGGDDTYSFMNYNTGVSVDLRPGEWTTTSADQLAYLGSSFPRWSRVPIDEYARGNIANAELFNGDTRSLIENAVGGLGDDSLTGNIANNQLEGLSGADTLIGNEGIDKLYGGLGADELDGGAGQDYAGYRFATAGVGVDLASGGFGGEANGDVVSNIEGLFGSRHDDQLLGNDDAQYNGLFGNEGNDTLIGRGGYDEVYGDDGNDLLDGGAGGDLIGGGAGFDTLTFASAEAGVTASLAAGGGTAGDATGDFYFADIEAIVGSRFADRLEGDASANTIKGSGGGDVLLGLAGNDRAIMGGGGADILDGGAGRDRLSGGGAADDFLFAAGYAVDRVSDFLDGTDDLDLSAFGFTAFSQVKALASNTAVGGLKLELGNGDVLIIDNFAKADLNAGDVIL